MQDTGSAPGAPAPDHRSRRRLIGAGLVGLAGSLLPQFAARAAAGSTDDTDPGPDAGDANSGGAGSPDDTTSDTLAPTGSAGSTQDTGVRTSA